MPIYKDKIVKDLKEKREEFEGNLSRDKKGELSEKLREFSENYTAEEIKMELEGVTYPGAVPTEEFDDVKEPRIPFGESRKWESHEAVNSWAQKILSETSSVAADGSQVDPIDEFEQPVGLVQVVWMRNQHSRKKDYERGVESEVLTPEDLLYEGPNGRTQVDDQVVPFERFRKETEVLEEKIREAGDKSGFPVVFYDGPLIPSYIQVLDQKRQKKYIEAIARLLAASKYHKVPLVGYVAGSKATEISEMIKNLEEKNIEKARDRYIVDEFLENWGDRTPLFKAVRDEVQEKLEATYKNQNYSSGKDIMFTYIRTGDENQIDRLEIPGWIQEENLTEKVMNVVRAEAGVGRGYPEILQAVDADAVISKSDRQEFVELIMRYAKENDIELNVNNKALSKERRRR